MASIVAAEGSAVSGVPTDENDLLALMTPVLLAAALDGKRRRAEQTNNWKHLNEPVAIVFVA